MQEDNSKDTQPVQHPSDITEDYTYNSQEEERGAIQGNSESMMSKSTIENFFDTEGILLRIEKTLRGFQKKEDLWVKVGLPIARDEFINMMMNSLRSIINPENMISVLTEDTIRELLLEKNYEFIFACHDEMSISEDDFEYLVNLHDHTMQLFLGHLLEGHGSKVVRQISGSLYYPEQKKEKAAFSFGDALRGK